jgi:hypothetical protein
MSRSQVERPKMRVLVSLACGWCGRTLESVEGERDANTGRVLLQNAQQVHVSGGRARCDACGGPMFLEDWRLAYDSPSPSEIDFEDGDSGGGKTAAA